VNILVREPSVGQSADGPPKRNYLTHQNSGILTFLKHPFEIVDARQRVIPILAW
jgi:hypothetical protein